jgi:hypothetical protein
LCQRQSRAGTISASQRSATRGDGDKHPTGFTVNGWAVIVTAPEDVSGNQSVASGLDALSSNAAAARHRQKVYSSGSVVNNNG